MAEIKTKPATKEYRKNFDRISWSSRVKKRAKITKAMTDDPMWNRDFKTVIVVNTDPNFGG
jgi:hypothetical protein